MRALIWSIRLLVFLVLFAFAVKNTDPVTLRLFLGATWQTPLIVLLLVFFVAGVMMGILAMTVPYFRQWSKKRQLEQSVTTPDKTSSIVQPPSAEG